jgi:hypothetical protein
MIVYISWAIYTMVRSATFVGQYDFVFLSHLRKSFFNNLSYPSRLAIFQRQPIMMVPFFKIQGYSMVFKVDFRDSSVAMIALSE